MNYVNIPVGKNFSYIINSNTIGLTNVNNSDALSDLPDGFGLLNILFVLMMNYM
jgi:hypothetical protein